MEYYFEELQIPGYGLGVLLYGKATIVQDGDGYCVESIVLDGGKALESNSPNKFDATIFHIIENILCDPSSDEGLHVLERWNDHMAGAGEPDPDYLYEQERDRRAGF